jgi:prepilin-type N-terminal cleavage/methylation domain-containing protein
MQVAKRLRNEQGFSLIELLIVTVLLGIMAEVVHYGFLSQMPRRHLQGATKQIAWDLMEARAQAIKRHSTVRLSFPDTHLYTIWNDFDNDGVVDADEEIRKDIHDSYHGIIIDIDTSVIANPLFTSRGTSSGNSTVLIKNTSGSKSLLINVSGFISTS